MINKNKIKKIIAILLAVITAFSCSVPALAVDDVSYWNGHTRLSNGGKDAFCINYGQAASGSFSSNNQAYTYWTNLGKSKRDKIEAIITCADQKGYLNSSSDATYFGVQRAIWSVVSNESESKLSSWFKSQTKSVYDDVLGEYKKYSKIPNIDLIVLEETVENAGTTQEKTVWVGSGTDINKVLSSGLWNISNSAGIESVKINGNKVEIRTKTRFDGEKKLSLVSTFNNYSFGKAQIGHYGSQQAIITSSASKTPSTATFNVSCNKINEGRISVTKRDDTGSRIEGVQFDLYNAADNSYLESIFTDENGYAVSKKYDEGMTINVYEVVPDGYMAPVYYKSVTVEYRADNSAKPISNDGSGYWTNILKRGDLWIHKNNESGVVQSGVQFDLIGANGFCLVGATTANGDLMFSNVPVGWYELREHITAGHIVPDGFWDNGDGTVSTAVFVSWDGSADYYTYNLDGSINGVLQNIVSGDTSHFSTQYTYLNVVNRFQRGDLKVYKNEEYVNSMYQGGQYRAGEGYQFAVSSSAADNLAGCDLYFISSTGADGYAYFCDLPVGTYTVSEINLSNAFVQPASQTVYVGYDGNTSYTLGGSSFSPSSTHFNNGAVLSFTNTLKKFRVNVTKEDSEKGSTAQGDATLEGAQYGLYKGDTLVKTYTTNAQGRFTTDYFVCANDWYIKEIGASEGYLINTDKPSANGNPAGFSVEYNDSNVTSKEVVKKGKIELYKLHNYDADTQQFDFEQDAEFQIYLKSSGSYDNAKAFERDLLTTNDKGYAISKDLPYGTYVVHQTKGAEGSILAPDFEVFIQNDGATYSYVLNNPTYQSYLKIVKKDAETGRTIPLNDVQGAKFQILNSKGEVVKMKLTYPKEVTIDTFTVNSEGYLVTPEKLPYGLYYLVEVQAPYGYYNPNYDVISPKIEVVTDADGHITYNYDFDTVEKQAFNISASNEDMESVITGSDIDADVNEIVVDKFNTAQKAVINVRKTGEVFSSVQENESNVFTPVYETQGLKGAVYTITAAEDIVTPDGTVRYAKGTLVDTLTTGNNGIAVSKQLYLGKYIVKEDTAPHGYAIDTNSYTVELTYRGQEYQLIDTSLTPNDERVKAQIDVNKYLECDDTFGLGKNEEYKRVEFGLYANEKIIAQDGTYIPQNGLIARGYLNSDNKVVFNADLPIDADYYIKEIATDVHYIKDNNKYEFSFDYVNQRTPIVKINVNNGEDIVNYLIYGSIKGHKVDDEGKSLAGATFGLFDKDCTEFTKDNAILTAVSGEDGIFEFEYIPYGDYLIAELSAPDNYVYSKEPVEVSVTKNHEVVEITVENILARGQIKISKTGEFFSSVRNNEDGTKTPLYKEQSLPNAVFEVIAAEDIVTPDGITRNKKGEVVDTITTNENGFAESKRLFLGKYIVKEVSAPDGFMLDTNEYNVTLEHKAKENPLVIENLEIVNARQKAIVNLKKQMEQDLVFNLGNNGELKNVVFGLFAKEKMTALDGAVINADSIIAMGKLDEYGSLVFDADVPYGYSYYVKELATDIHYSLSDATYEFRFTTNDRNIPTVEFYLNNGEVIVNTLLRGMIEGHKTDVNGIPLANAKFGLFYTDCTDFSEVNAIMTSVSDANGLFKFEYIDYGEYIVREIEAPESYALSEESVPVNITEHNQSVVINVTNEKIKGTIEITKQDAETGEALPHCKVEILDKDMNVVARGETDENGVVRFILEYGTYFYREFEAPEGYILDETPYEFSITHNDQIVKAVMINEAVPEEIEVKETPKTGTNIDIILGMAGFTAVAFGTLLMYYIKKKKSMEK